MELAPNTNYFIIYLLLLLLISESYLSCYHSTVTVDLELCYIIVMKFVNLCHTSFTHRLLCQLLIQYV